MNALLIVDVQNDFLPGGALAVPRGNEVVPIINELMHLKGKAFDIVVATQDWHPRVHKSFASQHPGYQVGDVIQLNGLNQVLWPEHCIQDSQGANFAPELEKQVFDYVVQKGTNIEVDSYSGFFDNGRRKATGLSDYLKRLGVADLYVLGLATDYCVKFTALDSVYLGFRTYLIEDGCRGVNLKPGDSQESIDFMKKAGVSVIASRDLDYG